MLELKNNRKRAEGDMQLLANRIALLRAEEQKALNKVKETKTRAKEILTLKKRNEDMLNEKLAHNLEREMEIKAVRDKSLRAKKNHEDKISRTRKAVEQSRRQQAIETMNMGKKVVDEAANTRLLIEEQNRKRAQIVRQRKEEALRRREAERQRKEREARELYLKKQEEENKRMAEAEKAIRKMENEERELIERLKKTQEMQQKAYNELQESLEL
eukprot:CAMPEP_0185021706 /NCGR_PEP_ID=MMETSP1103-20130426/4409_1 /TAXON_ID=36769 /ORGANISM="Paraphysomonas bandaiensis, Strain Caron Lab Isolate" /LENGTH=214 /DNA_ID=CAMNT_0027553401 /DNA_START=183 /DNA_END=827 /DNA_ORIENTATION=-